MKKSTSRNVFNIGQERRPDAIAPNSIPDLVPLNIDDEATVEWQGLALTLRAQVRAQMVPESRSNQQLFVSFRFAFNFRCFHFNKIHISLSSLLLRE